MITTYIDHPLRERNSFHVEEQAARIIEFDAAADLDSIFAEGNAPEKWAVLGGGNNILFTKILKLYFLKHTITVESKNISGQQFRLPCTV